MAYAYYEKIARINLTTGEIKVEKLDVELARSSSAAVVWVPRSSMTRAVPPQIPWAPTTSWSTSPAP